MHESELIQAAAHHTCHAARKGTTVAQPSPQRMCLIFPIGHTLIQDATSSLSINHTLIQDATSSLCTTRSSKDLCSRRWVLWGVCVSHNFCSRPLSKFEICMVANYYCRYCSDITCSYPVSGKFTADQKVRGSNRSDVTPCLAVCHVLFIVDATRKAKPHAVRCLIHTLTLRHIVRCLIHPSHQHLTEERI
jgi:hypothetical protein